MSNQKKVALVPSTKVAKVLKSLTTTSAKIRYLDSQGWSRGDISRTLNKRYQHVRNVLIVKLVGKK